MGDTQTTFHRALLTILAEVFNGPPGQMAFLLNPGDPGLIKQLQSVSARMASERPMPGKTTIAQHVEHVIYGLDLLNRWSAGEENPWATADWDAAWQTGAVDELEWRSMVDRLRIAFETWYRHAAARTDWDDIAAAGSLASAAHTAYHLGAIRQILAAAGDS